MIMSNPITVRNKKVCDKVRSFQDMLSKKTGKDVSIPTALNVMFSDDNVFKKMNGAKVEKKNRSKKKYVFEM